MRKQNMIRCLTILGASILTSTGLTAQEKSDSLSTSAVSTVTGEDLYHIQTSNLSNTWVGMIPGLTVLQGTGEVGNDNARWLIRGVGSYGVGNWNSAKIFVDGFEVNSEYLVSLSPSEIESVSVLKDGAALAIYGDRGANGVIRIETKRGKTGPATVSAKVRYGAQTPTVLNKPLGSYDFANLYNQAVSNDNGMVWSPAYTPEQLEAYRNGTGVDVDWYDEVMRSAGSYMDGDIIFNGGNANARYNVTLGYVNAGGLLNTSNTDATKNLGYERYNLRANLDFNIMKIFEFRVDFGGRLEMRRRPNYGISSLFNDLARYPSNIYNIYDDAEQTHLSGTAIYPNNPYASVNELGWYSQKARSLQGNFVIREKLDIVTPGLYLEEAFSFYSYTLSTYSKTKNYARWFNGENTTTDESTSLVASGYGSGGMQDWKQGRLTIGYDRDFGKNKVSAAVNYNISAYKGDGYFSYKYNYLNLNGIVDYSFDDRYVAQLAFSYFGNDSFAPGHRWHFYPAASFAWVASNEEFLRNSSWVDFLKVRLSAGAAGASDSGATSVLSNFSSNGRFLFKDYYANSYVGSFYMGQNGGSWQNTLVPMFVPNEDIVPERSMKYNVGIDAMLFGGLSITADAFLDKRSDILTLDNSKMGYYGKQYHFSNVGEMTNRGFEASAMYSGKSGDFSYRVNGMVSFARNTIDYMAEVAPANEFSAQTGRPYGTIIGLKAERFFDVNDFDNAGNLKEGIPVPAFGSVQPGDVKYADLDGNDVVDQNDVTAIGKSAYPEWYYSFGGKIGWKGFDLEVLFQGAAGASVNLLDNWNQTVAFVDNGNAYEIAKSAWAYYPAEGIDTRASARFPRLSTQSNENNYQTSSLWIRSADYLKLRNLELGYNFNTMKLQKAGIENLRIYLSGHNLLTFSGLLRNYDLDPEGFGYYPTVRSCNVGVSITF
ncbi:MAG: SusC/RagA family TonB-linked outer membrane protein [Bacteroidales bacterium]|nr:SusC/RagA family TonB-linked outer membrane protein [Bacteroidales bacterium]